MSWYQCSTCGDLFASAGDLAAHKRANHLKTAMIRQSARRRVVAAALALTAGTTLTFCESPEPSYASTPSTTPPSVVVDVTPPAVMPVSVSVPATSPSDPHVPPAESVAVEVATISPSLPETGGAELALACWALGFVLVGASMWGPLARRRS